jgi:polyisoprenoid-binding protein YceI
MRPLLALLLGVPLAAASTPAPREAAIALDVSPACCAITFTAYAFGLLPLEGSFSAFSGRLNVPAGGKAHAEARIEAASLSLGGGPIEEDVKAPHFLDVARYREILFSAGAVDPGSDALSGMLTIRGVSRPVTLVIARNGRQVTAEARISRRAFGITARPLLAGDTIEIRISAPLPP